MKHTFALLTLAATMVFAEPMPQGVTAALAPPASPPQGCSTSTSGQFSLEVVNITGNPGNTGNTGNPIAPGAMPCANSQSNILTLQLSGGTLTDQAGRTGYIASNDQ